MGDEEIFELPELITLEDYNGDFKEYEEAIYEEFVEDFINNPPTFEDVRLGLKKHPIVNGKEATYYHFTHEGSDEANRTPDLRRMERIMWIASMIDNSNHPYIKVWKKKHKRSNRILIYHEEKRYLVVLEDRGEYILPWTAYIVKYNNKHRKLLKEYNNFLESKS